MYTNKKTDVRSTGNIFKKQTAKWRNKKQIAKYTHIWWHIMYQLHWKQHVEGCKKIGSIWGINECTKTCVVDAKLHLTPEPRRNRFQSSQRLCSTRKRGQKNRTNSILICIFHYKTILHRIDNRNCTVLYRIPNRNLENLLKMDHGKWVPCHLLRLPRRSPDTVGSWEYTEQAVAESRQGVVLRLRGWARG
jgi:hypothetical protein